MSANIEHRHRVHLFKGRISINNERAVNLENLETALTAGNEGRLNKVTNISAEESAAWANKKAGQKHTKH